MLLLRLGIISYGDNIKQKVIVLDCITKQCDVHSFRMPEPDLGTEVRLQGQSTFPLAFLTSFSEGKSLYGSLTQPFDNLFWDTEILYLPQFSCETHPEKTPSYRSQTVSGFTYMYFVPDTTS